MPTIHMMYIMHTIHMQIRVFMQSTKNIRMHILLDESLRKLLSQGAHNSWMSVGQYIREAVALFKGAHYDTAADWVMIGQSIGLEAFENLQSLAQRKGIPIAEFCATLGKGRSIVETNEPAAIKDADQLSLFEQ
jgi:hypothetical protein